MLEAVGAARVHFDPPQAFANLNTREDLQRLEAERQNLNHQR